MSRQSEKARRRGAGYTGALRRRSCISNWINLQIRHTGREFWLIVGVGALREILHPGEHAMEDVYPSGFNRLFKPIDVYKYKSFIVTFCLQILLTYIDGKTKYFLINKLKIS